MTNHPSHNRSWRVAIVIPTIRNPGLARCLASLQRTVTTGVAAEIYVVLNNATPEVCAIANSFSDTVTVIDLPMNLGTGAAFNLAMDRSGADYLVTMQDDVEVEPDWLLPLVSRAESAPDIGAVGGLVLTLDGDVWDAGWVIWRDGTTSPAWLHGSRDPTLFPESRTVDQHGSVALLLSRSAWQSISGFDDDFYPAYYSDVDTCLRLHERGWRVVYEPTSRMRHAINTSSTIPFRDFLLQRNHKKFAAAHAEALASRPVRSEDPAEIAAVVAARAEQAEGLAPSPATAAELLLLEERTQRTPEEMLQRERDLWVDFANQLIVERTQTSEHVGNLEAANAALEHVCAPLLQRLEAAERGLDAERAAHADTHGHLEAVALSYTWRYTAPLRALRARLRRS